MSSQSAFEHAEECRYQRELARQEEFGEELDRLMGDAQEFVRVMAEEPVFGELIDHMESGSIPDDWLGRLKARAEEIFSEEIERKVLHG